MKFRIFLSVSALLCAIVPSQAEAAYSGTIERSVCAAGSLVPVRADRTYWDLISPYGSDCRQWVNDPNSSTNYHYASASIPVERKSGTTPIQTKIWVHGGASGAGRTCAAAYVYYGTGSLAGSTGSACTAAPTGSREINPGTLTLPVAGVMLINIGAQAGGYVYTLSHQWEVNASP